MENELTSKPLEARKPNDLNRNTTFGQAYVGPRGENLHNYPILLSRGDKRLESTSVYYNITEKVENLSNWK